MTEDLPRYGWRWWLLDPADAQPRLYAPMRTGILEHLPGVPLVHHHRIRNEAATSATFLAACHPENRPSPRLGVLTQPTCSQPPGPGCVCGVYYVGAARNLLAEFDLTEPGKMKLRELVDGMQFRFDTSRIVVTYGRGIGTLRPDPAFHGWGTEQPTRAAGFEILGALVSGDCPAAEAIERQFDVPVLHGLNVTTASDLRQTIGVLA